MFNLFIVLDIEKSIYGIKMDHGRIKQFVNHDGFIDRVSFLAVSRPNINNLNSII